MKKIALLCERFGVSLIDCPPARSLRTVKARTASNAVVTPCQTLCPLVASRRSFERVNRSSVFDNATVEATSDSP